MKFEVGDVVVPSEDITRGNLAEGFAGTELLVYEIGLEHFTATVLKPSRWHNVGYNSTGWTIECWTVKENNKTFEDCL